MRKYIPKNIPLALASGVNDENIVSFQPYVDRILVATSITERTKDFGGQEYLVPDKVSKLVFLAHV